LLAECRVERYVALDFSAAMQALARDHLAGEAGHVAFLQRDFRDPGWNAGLDSFDAVVTLQAAHEVRHAPKVATLLAQARACLRSEGVLLYCDHYLQPGRNPDLFLDRAGQSRALSAAGFAAVECLLDKDGMALHRAGNAR
jgi:SAM-dependent methyltransferase